jgi:hypothetical protein
MTEPTFQDPPSLQEALAQMHVVADQAFAEIETLKSHRSTLAAARDILLEYQFGAPDTPSFPEVLSPVQTAVLAYRDSGIEDSECDRHIMWINARVNEINAVAGFGAGILQ